MISFHKNSVQKYKYKFDHLGLSGSVFCRAEHYSLLNSAVFEDFNDKTI